MLARVKERVVNFLDGLLAGISGALGAVLEGIGAMLDELAFAAADF